VLQAVQKFYAKSESVRAYTMLSPALILIILLMLIPMILMLSFSFFTQISFVEIDYTFTIQRYIDFFQKNLLVTLLIKSVKISFLVTLVTLLTAYPVCYYIAFYVKKKQNVMASHANSTLLDILSFKSFFLENYFRNKGSYKLIFD
jgi:ABC-type spermidine/putrescine transport system permease subunit I